MLLLQSGRTKSNLLGFFCLYMFDALLPVFHTDPDEAQTESSSSLQMAAENSE